MRGSVATVADILGREVIVPACLDRSCPCNGRQGSPNQTYRESCMNDEDEYFISYYNEKPDEEDTGNLIYRCSIETLSNEMRAEFEKSSMNVLIYFELESKHEIFSSNEKVSSAKKDVIIGIQRSLREQGIDVEDDDRITPYSSLDEKIAVHNAALKRFEEEERAFEIGHLHTEDSALMVELFDESFPSHSSCIPEMIRLRDHADRVRKAFNRTQIKCNGKGIKKTLPNNKRDARLYELYCDTENYPNGADIVSVIKKEFDEYQVEIPAAREAAKRYAKRHGLPPIPLRKPGRPSQR